MTIAISYYDRYNSNTKELLKDTQNKIDPELIALGALYLAVKLHEPKKTFLIEDFVYMSGRQYSANDIEVMEFKLLSTLSWFAHPPTPQAFVRYFLHFLPNSMCAYTHETVLRISYFIIDIAAYEDNFMTEKPSSIAHASIIIAVNKMGSISLSCQEQSLLGNRLKSVEEIIPAYEASIIHQLDHIINGFDFNNNIRSLISPKVG